MTNLYYIDSEELTIKTTGVDNRITSEELDLTYGEGLWFYDEESAQTELEVILYNLELN